jgi:hypothetical protein
MFILAVLMQDRVIIGFENVSKLKYCGKTVTYRRQSQWPRARALGFVGPNPTRSMYVCVRLFCVCVVPCVGSGIATG